MPKSFLIKKGKEYGNLSSNADFQEHPTVTEGEPERHVFSWFQKYPNYGGNLYFC